MVLVEPVPGAPAATADLGGERALVVADYHAGLEAALRGRGVELDSRADGRLARLLDLLDRTDADRVIFLGDLAHRIGEPGGAERGELEDVLCALADRVPALLVPGNHDGALDLPIPTADAAGVRLGEVGFAHGHTWPVPEVLAAETVCVGHEHPAVRLEDEVGGRRIERVWLRGRLAPEAFCDRADPDSIHGELVVFPAFNDLAGGTWVNVEGQGFLAPFLPDGLAGGEAYLLDGTRLGDYREL